MNDSREFPIELWPHHIGAGETRLLFFIWRQRFAADASCHPSFSAHIWLFSFNWWFLVHMTHCSAVGLKPAIVASPECRAVPTSGETARSEYHFAVEGNCPRADWTVGVWAKASPHRQWTIRQRRTSVGSGSAANALSPNRKAAERGCKHGSPVGNLRHCLCNRCRPICGNLGCVTFSDLGTKSMQEASWTITRI